MKTVRRNRCVIQRQCGAALPTALLLITILFQACGQNDVDKAFKSDARGYFCLACQTRFSTDFSIHADACPACKSFEIDQVLGFVCPKDAHTTLAPRGRGATACEKCGRVVTAIKLPTGAELTNWGATGKSRIDVLPSAAKKL